MARGPRWVGSDGNALSPAKFDPFDLIVIGSTFAGRVVGAAGEALSSVGGLLRCHANWRSEQREFADEARETIERLP